MADEIVSVDLTLEDSVASIQNFGNILIFAKTLAASHPISSMKTYNVADGTAALIADGYIITDDAVRKLQAIASQSPRTVKIKVWNRATANVQTIRLTPTVVTQGTVYPAFTANAQPVPAYTVGAAATAQTITDAYATIVAALTAVAAVTSGVGAAAVLNITPEVPTTRVYLDNVPRLFTVKDTSPDGGIATEYTNAKASGDVDWMYVLTDSQSEVEANVLAPLVLADKKIYVHQTADTDVFTAGSADIGSDQKALGNHNCVVFCTRYMSTQLAAGITSKMAGFDPGFVSWHNQDVTGAGEDVWNASEISQMDGKNVMHFERSDGLRRTFGGYAASGRFLDLTIGLVYTIALVKQNVLSQNHAASQAGREPPQSDKGIGQIQGWADAPLQNLVTRGLLKEASVTVPKYSSLLSGDLLTRTLNGMRIGGTFGGKWHKIKFTGSLKAA